MKPRETTQFTHLFTPIRVGRMDLPNRIMATPHADYRGLQFKVPVADVWGIAEQGVRI